ncbi:Small-subunit processome Utp12 [Penicillium atrosanguineum]|uniref:Small-subunit processome Utp12 n=1 Tax=Penicillium atrosanguineum TaxID=1132637 RepID=UPI00239FEC66|nr:Small-subunit processome Utp12 [Penicillium atrosanguineum]KAJ5298919.1 Small-subunit processome Utp12 [Penicillium atrosanguineum]
MSYNRVLPNPVALHHVSSQVSLPRSSNLIEHKIMNDLPMSHGALPLRPDPLGAACRYPEARHPSTGPTNQDMTTLDRAKPELNPQMGRPTGPLLTTNDLALRDSSSSSSRGSSPRMSKEISWCLCKPDPKIPRPRNSFILYRQHYQAAVVHQNPGLSNPDISKIIGRQWKALSDEEREKWNSLAREEKDRHQQQYPDYRYQPKRSGRDGSARGSVSGISHNPSGQSTCNRCGGRIMNAPSSPMTPFTPTDTPISRSSLSAGSCPITVMSRRSSCRADTKPQPKPVRVDQLESRARRFPEEDHAPDVKRRRVSHQPQYAHRDRSPEITYPMSPYTRSELQHPSPLPMIHTQRFGSIPSSPHPDLSLKLPPLKTTTPMTPLTPFSQDGSVEATVMTIPFLNKIKVLAKISPPSSLPSATQSQPPSTEAPQDPQLVQIAVDFLDRLLQKESKYSVRIFPGPEAPDPSQIGDAGMNDYIDKISAWHRISDEVNTFIKSDSTRSSPDADSASASSLSPKTVFPKTATLQVNSPPDSSEASEASPSQQPQPVPQSPIPVALVPRYQLTTADAFACSIPIQDSYTPLDHWQWMASLWRGCTGPDITVYIRECTKDELDRAGGSPVEVRLQDARTVILRKVAGTSRELEEKALKRVGFEIEDFLTG